MYLVAAGLLLTSPRAQTAPANRTALNPGFRLLPGSPSRRAGVPLPHNGGRDFFGGKVPVDGPPSIGAHNG